MKKSTRQVLYWTPRGMTFLFAVFISLFGLDVFSEDYGFWQSVLAFFIHLIPTFLILLFLLLAWRWEWIGALVYMAFGFFYIFTAYGRFPLSTYFIIAGPLFLVGLLFLLNWILFKNKRPVES